MAEDAGSTIEKRRDETVARLQAQLRRMVRDSGRTQRSIERDNGFRKGYLSQVLQGSITLTVRHLIGILQSLDIPPSAFFDELDEPWTVSPPPLSEIRERLAVFDQALHQLAQKGLVDLPNADSGEAENVSERNETAPESTRRDRSEP